jgi:hypothetical protein
MSSRDYIRNVVSANTSINGQRVGDEVYDPTTNKLYKTLPIGGTEVTNSEVLLNNRALANNTITVGRINLATYTSSNSTNTGTLVVGGGVGVSESLYVGNRMGFSASVANATSVAYQVYNPLGSIDVTFG